MTVVRAAIDIAAPCEDVWAVVMDVRRFPDWVTIHHKLGKHDDGPPRVGYEVEQVMSLRGAHFKVRWRLVECRDTRMARWEGKGPARSLATTEYRLSETEIDGNPGCHFAYLNEFKAPGGPLGAAAGRVLVGGISEREANATLRKLKALLERSG